MAWQFDPNNLDGVEGGAEAMYRLKELLVACGYAVIGSGGGTGSGLYSAVGDVIGSAALFNVSQAWVRLQAPATMAPRRELCFQRGSGGNTKWWIKVSAEDGFVGGAPDEDDMPTATDEQNLWGSTTAGSSLFNVAASYRIHCGADDATPFGFYMVALTVATGVCGTAVVFDPLVAGTFPAADDDPAVYFAAWNFGNECMSTAVVGDESVGPLAWYGKDLAGEAWQRYPGLTLNTGNGAAQCMPGWGTNKYTGYDEHFPIAYGRRAAIVNPGWKGFGSVMRWLATTRANGDTLSTAGVRTRLVLGNVVIPWPDVLPII